MAMESRNFSYSLCSNRRPGYYVIKLGAHYCVLTTFSMMFINYFIALNELRPCVHEYETK